MHLLKSIFWLVCLAYISCDEAENNLESLNRVEFEDPRLVTVEGYDSHIMESFLSRDGSILFFNNLNTPNVNTNLHWCTKINDTLFRYEGELENINTPDLEGVPSMDENNQFYYVYTGTFEETLSTIYQGKFSDGRIENPELVENISRNMFGQVNFDLEISNDGETLYFVDGRFDQNGGPYESNFVIAIKRDGQFSRLEESEIIMQNINTEDLEYAAAITKNELEISFTRAESPLGINTEPKIYVATRTNVNETFANVQRIENFTGFVEATTYTPDGSGVYFHRKENDLHRLYYARKL
ncbi:MAG: hypothetical protein AAF363_12180 [Bacteroidota bacterium]